jgi:hypothetical protein
MTRWGKGNGVRMRVGPVVKGSKVGKGVGKHPRCRICVWASSFAEDEEEKRETGRDER